ncbi:MAG: hypothetical protein ACI815_000956 [Psychroserpens sp.]|jgi:hypothetical protein
MEKEHMMALTFPEFGTPSVLEYMVVPKPTIQDNKILVRTKAMKKVKVLAKFYLFRINWVSHNISQ